MFTEWDNAFVYFLIFVVVFVLSFTCWKTIFRELDYYETKYKNKKNKGHYGSLSQLSFLQYCGCVSYNCFFHAYMISPPPVMATDVDAAAINCGIRIEKIYENVKKAIDKVQTNKIVGYMFDFKHEVEQYTGKKIDINKQLDKAQKQAKAQSQKIDDKYVKKSKKFFKKDGKKHKHRAVWFAQCAEFDVPYTMVEADMHFDMNYKTARGGHEKYEQKEDVPIAIMVGVKVTLCGMFLWFVPLPGCQVAGQFLFTTSTGILASDALARWDACDQEQRKK